MFIDNYYFSVNIKDCLFLEFDMPHQCRTTITTDYFIKKNQQIQLFFSFVFKVMEYSQTHTQKFNLNQEKNDFLLPLPPLLEGGGVVATPLPPNFWNDPPGRKLLPQFCSAYSYRRVNWR